MENWEGWLTILVACALLLGLARRLAPPDVLALICLGILMLVQDITESIHLPDPAEAVAGFGNRGLITVALLFAVVAGMEFTGGTQLATGWLLGKAKSLTDAQAAVVDPGCGRQRFFK